MNLPESVVGVTKAATVYLDGAASPRWLVANCEPQHFNWLRIGRARALVLQGLNGRWREPDLVKCGLPLACAGKRQMRVVHGIEATAENAEAHGLGAGDWGLGAGH